VTPALFRIELLGPQHDRTQFCSGSTPLDSYFQQQVSQDARRRITTCFVTINKDQQIAGFYTLASTSIVLTDLPRAIGKKLPRYPTVPAVRMGRLAVDQNFKGAGLGGALLADALARASKAEIAAFALVVDAKDSIASEFYRHHGFISFAGSPMSLFLPLATASAFKP
jgi:ribosomal protein S18 acetylase RimI-like enzyme